MISLIYLTNRENPQFHWFIDSLFYQTTDVERAHEIELVFVDHVLGIAEKHDARIDALKQAIAGKFNFKHVAPKPNLYQGASRKTENQYFSASNARNTGAMVADGSYLVYCDDVSVLMPGWFDAVKHAKETNMIVCGAYQKHFELNVIGGMVANSVVNPGGIDSRWHLGNDQSPVDITGQQMYGCSFGIEKRIYVELNGMDEICDSIGGEDYQFGIRLNHAGHAIKYWRKMFTIESEEMHNQQYLMRRDDRTMHPDRYMERLRQFGVHERFRRGNWDSSHMILDLLHGLRQTKALKNNGELAEFTGIFPDVQNETTHWFDGKPLIEM